MDGEPDGAELIDDSIFIWTVPADFLGQQVVTFIVEDNGVPPLSSSVEDTITVSDEEVNHAPQWDVETLELTIKDTDLCTLELPTICRDEDGDPISYSLVSGPPPGDTINETTYSFQATSEAIGSYDVRIVASDPESDPLSGWTIASNPSHGSITGTLPTVTYTPSGNYEGSDSFTFTVSDGTSTSAAATVSITVTANNIAPSIVTHPTPKTVNKGQSATFTASINSDAYPAPNYIRWVHNNSDTVSGVTTLSCSILADQ